jgi:hypothetical protein
MSPKLLARLAQRTIQTIVITFHPSLAVQSSCIIINLVHLWGIVVTLSSIWRGFAPGFVNYKKGWTRLAATSDKVYQLLAHDRWFSPGTPASSTTKTGCHDIAEISLKVALNTKNQSLCPSVSFLINSCCNLNQTWQKWYLDGSQYYLLFS